MRARFRNPTITNDGAIEADFEVLEGSTPLEPPVETDLPTAPPPTAVDESGLPVGFDSDRGVAFSMLVQAMQANGLDPIGVQGHGQQIVDALKRTFPALDVYVSEKDAPVWPGFGSIDVTIDSGKGGWQFRDDGDTAWVPG